MSPQKTGFNHNFVKKCFHSYAIVYMHVFIYTEINRGEILHENNKYKGRNFLGGNFIWKYKYKWRNFSPFQEFHQLSGCGSESWSLVFSC